MSEPTKRATIYFDPPLHAALRMKAAQSELTISEIVNQAVRAALAGQREDQAGIADRVSEPASGYETLVDGPRATSRKPRPIDLEQLRAVTAGMPPQPPAGEFMREQRDRSRY